MSLIFFGTDSIDVAINKHEIRGLRLYRERTRWHLKKLVNKIQKINP
jgi:hypothetical protein